MNGERDSESQKGGSVGGSSFTSSDEDEDEHYDDATKPTLLLANDNLFLLNAYAKMIRKSFTVFKAENGLEAYKIAIRKPRHFFDAILLGI
jgi:hypothetical protein